MSCPTPKQYIRIPAAAWNAYESPSSIPRQEEQESKEKTQLNLKMRFNLGAEQPSAQRTRVAGATQLQQDPVLASSPARHPPRTPKRTKIQHASLTTSISSPCPSSPHKQSLPKVPCQHDDQLWKAPRRQLSAFTNRLQEDRPVVEPLSPAIDPRILNDTWRTYLPSSSPISSPIDTPCPSPRTPVLTPVQKPSFSPPVYQHFSSPSPPSYDIFLPTSLVNMSISTAPARSVWRGEARRRLTVRLKVGSRLGEWVKMRERKERKRKYDRARRARMKGRVG